MTHPERNPSRPLPGWRATLAAALAAATVLVACGGGGDGGTSAAIPAAPAATTSAGFTLGTISGFGSVVVGGVRYDDSKATISDEDGNTHRSSDLRLGMVVALDAGSVDRASATGLAERIRFGSEIVGPVGSIDTTASTLTLLGQTVLVTTSTVFDSSLSGGLSALTAGALIEVHGLLDQATGQITATRIEPKAGATAYKLRGVVAALDTAAKTFKIGSETINYAGVTTVPSTLADGIVVRVRLQTTQVSGAWVATRLALGSRVPDGNVSDVHVEGRITAFTSNTAFVINGLSIDATNASFPDGTAGVVLGARVEVEGRLSNGVLVASKVEIEDRRDHGHRRLELHGAIAAIDTTAKTFVVKAVTVSYAGTVTYKDGAEADLALGKNVEVRGTLSADRTKLEATRIEFKN